MPRKKKGSSPSVTNSELTDCSETCVTTVELPDCPETRPELTLVYLYDMIMQLKDDQKDFQKQVMTNLKQLEEKNTTSSDNVTTIVKDTWTNISTCIGVLGGKLEYIEKQFEEMHSAEVRPNKIIVKGVPSSISDEESVNEYINKMMTVLGDDINAFTAERIIVKDKPGPIQVYLKTENIVFKILRNKRSLREVEETVYVNPYLSKQQRRTDFNIRQIAKATPKMRYSGGRVHLET